MNSELESLGRDYAAAKDAEVGIAEDRAERREWSWSDDWSRGSMVLGFRCQVSARQGTSGSKSLTETNAHLETQKCFIFRLNRLGQGFREPAALMTPEH